MEIESTSTSTPTDVGNDSPSSVTAEATISDSQEQLISNENTETDEVVVEERKVRRINRRKALALENSPLPAPKLGRVLGTANNTIDLTTEDDDPNNRWFKKTFAAPVEVKKNSPENSKAFAVPHKISKNAPRSLIIRDTLKKKLQASMAVKRRKEQEQRRKMYEEDNEHLKPPTDDEDEEEEEIIKKKKKVKKPPRNDDDEYNSEDDEDYKEEDSPPENSSDEEENAEKPTNSLDENGRADDEMSVNLLDDSFTYDVFNHVKRPGPGSTVSNFDGRSQTDEVEKNGIVQLPFSNGNDDFGDILNLCSGNFEAKGGFPDTLQMLLDEEKSRKPVVPVNPVVNDEMSDDEMEDTVIKKKTAKPGRVLDSDEEDELVEETSKEDSEPVEESVDVEDEKNEKNETRRIVLSGDEDSEEEEEVEEEPEDEEEEEEVEEEVENNEEEEKEEAEPNFDDEDDELAVYKRIEHQEYKQNVKKKSFFDDEASLSGDDVGSEAEDDDGNNDYEAEEGDGDDVPDDDTIRRQNHKLLLKQESDREQRALAKLQDRLLADGDLGGVETNRQFRFKLREEVNVQMADGAGIEEDQEEDEPDEDEEKKKERAEMIKYKIEHAEELMLLDDPKEDDDMFRRAGQSMKVSGLTVSEQSEEVVVKKRVVKPSLLAKTSLAATFQEVLNGGSAAPKQMYVQTRNSEMAPIPTSGAVKRGRQSPEKTAAKRVRQSKLSALE